jgi:phage shock protein PspC (stress-responsive transcriptional regulator)
MSDEKNNESETGPGQPDGEEPADAVEEPAEETVGETEAPAPEPAAMPPAQSVYGQAAASAPVRRLVRRPEGKVIAGVCSGLGAYTGIDPVAWRIAFVVLAIFGGGVGLVGYIVAWLIMPMAAEGEPIQPTSGLSFDGSNVGRWIGIGAIVLGAIVLFHNVWDFSGGIFWGLLLVGVGIALWGHEFGSGSRANGARAPNPPPEGAASTTSGNPSNFSTVTQPTPPLPPVPPAPARAAASFAPTPSPSRREPSVLGRIVVGAAALAVGIGVLLDNVGVLNINAKGMFAVLLAIVAIGLLVGSWVGRARWLIIPGIILAVMLAVAAILPTTPFGSYGDVLWQPASRTELRSAYEHGAGEAVLDLTQMSWGRNDRSVDVNLGFGQLLVVVPDDIPVEVSAHVQGGEMNLFNRRRSGWDIEESVIDGGDSDLGTLELDIEMNFGELEVRRARPGEEFNSGDFDRRGRFGVGVFRGGPRIDVDTNTPDD